MKRLYVWVSILIMASMLVSACGATPTPQVVEKIVTQQVVVTQPVEKIVTQQVVITKEVEKLVTPVVTPAPPRPLVVVQGSEVVTLDPHVNWYGYSKIAQRGMYEPLFEFTRPDQDCKYDFDPVLATSWESSADGKTWTFHLRTGVKFSDGTPFNADAVKWNMDRLLSLAQVPSSSLAPVVQETKVVDDSTVQVVLKQPWAPFIRDMSYVVFISPTAAKQNEVSGDQGQKWLYDHAVGTGPYLLKEWVHGSYVSLEKNPDYWGGWDGNHIQSVVIKFIPDTTTQKVMLIQADVDVAMEISAPDDLAELEKSTGVKVELQCAGASILTFQMKNRGPLADARVRRAIALAFDYDGFAQGVMKGRFAPASGPLTPGAEWGALTDQPTYKKDIATAKKLLADAGYPNGLPKPLEIWVVSSYLWYEKDAAEILQAGLTELGITLNIVDQGDVATFLAGAFNQDPNQGPDLYGWSIETASGDPDLNLRMYHSAAIPPKGMDGSFYSNPKFDALLDASAAELDQAKRLPMIQDLQRILIEDQPAIFLTYITRFYTYNAALQNYYTLYFGHVGLYWKYSLMQ